MKCTCKQCGKEYELKPSEIQFYKSRNLNLPKRCQECRDQNRQRRQKEDPGMASYQTERKKKYRPRSSVTTVVFILVLCVAFLLRWMQDGGWRQDFGASEAGTEEFAQREELPEAEYAEDTEKTQAVQIALDERVSAQKEELSETEYVKDIEKTQETQTAPGGRTFRNRELLNDHYEKHGVKMGFASAAEYEAAAANVVGNPDSLHKLEAEDGDDVYYLESTNEFVIVSTDGYIRTYFCPEDGMEYYNRQ